MASTVLVQIREGDVNLELFLFIARLDIIRSGYNISEIIKQDEEESEEEARMVREHEIFINCAKLLEERQYSALFDSVLGYKELLFSSSSPESEIYLFPYFFVYNFSLFFFFFHRHQSSIQHFVLFGAKFGRAR